MLIMRVSAIQMDMKFADPAYNFKHAEELIREAAASKPDVIVLPETWNTGFFPKENLKELSDKDGAAVKDMCSALARELNVNIVAGSVSLGYPHGGPFDRKPDVRRRLQLLR